MKKLEIILIILLSLLIIGCKSSKQEKIFYLGYLRGNVDVNPMSMDYFLEEYGAELDNICIYERDQKDSNKINVSAFLCNFGGMCTVTLPNTVKEIKERNFSNSKGIRKVVIPKSVTSIDENAFNQCEDLLEIVNYSSIDLKKYVDENVRIIDDDSKSNISLADDKFLIYKDPDKTILLDFIYTKKAKEEFTDTLVIPDYITEIANIAFAASEFKEIILPNGLKKIGKQAFLSSSLEKIIIPNTVNVIEEGAFCDCVNLEELVLSNSLESIEEATFYMCAKLKDVVIPDSVVSVGKNAFAMCHSLYNLRLGNSIKTIKTYAFSECYNISSVTLPSSLQTLEKNSFQQCIKLVEVINKSSIELVKPNSSGIIDYAIQIIQDESDSKISLTNDNFVLLDNNGEIYLVNYLGNDKDIKIPPSISIINKNAFYDNRNIISLVIPRSVTLIDNNSLYNCYSLEYIYYEGNAEDFKNVEHIYMSNISNRFRICYYSEKHIFSSGMYYWHYENDVPTLWK